MEAEAAPWAPAWVRFFTDLPLWGRVAIFAPTALVAFDAGGWFLTVLPIMGIILDRGDHWVQRHNSVWFWSDSNHSRVPYWMAWRLINTPYWDFALYCVEKCSQYSVEGSDSDRNYWQDRLYRIYQIYASPQSPVRDRTPHELQSFLDLYDN